MESNFKTKFLGRNIKEISESKKNKLNEELDIRIQNIQYIEDKEILSEQLIGLLRTTVIATNLNKLLKQTNFAKTHITGAKGGIKNISTKDTNQLLSDTLNPLLDGLATINESIRALGIIASSSGVFSDRTYNLLKKIEKKNFKR